MNFNKFANTIITEKITPAVVTNEEVEGKRGRAGNPEIEKLVAQGMPYWKARALVKKGLTGGSSEPEVVDIAKSIDVKSPEFSGGSSVSAAKTQAAVDDYIAVNPDAKIEDVVAHLKALNAGPLAIKNSYITDPKLVTKMVDLATSDTKEEPEEFAFDPDTERKDKIAKLRAFLMMPKAKRDEFLARKSKIAKAKDARSYRDDDEEEDRLSRKIDMRDEPVDPTEL